MALHFSMSGLPLVVYMHSSCPKKYALSIMAKITQELNNTAEFELLDSNQRLGADIKAPENRHFPDLICEGRNLKVSYCDPSERV